MCPCPRFTTLARFETALPLLHRIAGPLGHLVSRSFSLRASAKFFLHSAKSKNKSFRGQIAFMIEEHAKFCKRPDFAISSVLKTGDLARDLLEGFPHLYELRGESIFEFRPRCFL